MSPRQQDSTTSILVNPHHPVFAVKALWLTCKDSNICSFHLHEVTRVFSKINQIHKHP